jgi:hypothetical protein
MAFLNNYRNGGNIACQASIRGLEVMDETAKEMK